jgi:hypothetical protein
MKTRIKFIHIYNQILGRLKFLLSLNFDEPTFVLLEVLLDTRTRFAGELKSNHKLLDKLLNIDEHEYVYYYELYKYAIANRDKTLFLYTNIRYINLIFKKNRKKEYVIPFSIVDDEIKITIRSYSDVQRDLHS